MSIHNKYAPYWALAIVLIGSTGLATNLIDLGDFWRGYVLDIAGPAWNYILFRGLFTAKANNQWTRFFTPKRTFIIFIAFCVFVETIQYLDWYDSTYDPWDFLAYISLITPLFILDSLQTSKSTTQLKSPKL